MREQPDLPALFQELMQIESDPVEECNERERLWRSYRIEEIVEALHNTRAENLAGVEAQLNYIEYVHDDGGTVDFGDQIYRNIVSSVRTLVASLQKLVFSGPDPPGRSRSWAR